MGGFQKRTECRYRLNFVSLRERDCSHRQLFRPFIDPICRNSYMVLSMFYRLVLANFLFSLRDINLTLGPLPPRRHVLWRVRVLGQGLNQSARIFFTRVFCVITQYLRAPKRVKQLSVATIPLCFELFRCRVDVLQR